MPALPDDLGVFADHAERFGEHDVAAVGVGAQADLESFEGTEAGSTELGAEAQVGGEVLGAGHGSFLRAAPMLSGCIARVRGW